MKRCRSTRQLLCSPLTGRQDGPEDSWIDLLTLQIELIMPLLLYSAVLTLCYGSTISLGFVLFNSHTFLSHCYGSHHARNMNNT